MICFPAKSFSMAELNLRFQNRFLVLRLELVEDSNMAAVLFFGGFFWILGSFLVEFKFSS